MRGLPQKIKQLRESRGWSQRELARKMGVDASYVCQLENGSTPRPSLELVVKLQRVFNVRYEVFARAAGYIDGASDIKVYEDPEIEDLTEKIRGLHPVKRAAVHAVVSAFVATG